MNLEVFNLTFFFLNTGYRALRETQEIPRTPYRVKKTKTKTGHEILAYNFQKEKKRDTNRYKLEIKTEGNIPKR